MKNKIYKAIIGILPAACLFVMSSCKEPMKEYYGTGSDFKEPGTESLMTKLKANPEYSTFTYLLEQTGMDQMLKDNMVMTIWVPRNDDMPFEIATLDHDAKVLLMKNHISLGSITTQNLANLSTVVSLSSRYMPNINKNGVFEIDGAPLLNTDIMCTNGVIHEISKWFVPRVTLDEFRKTLSDEYSIYRDSLKNRDVYTFDRINSIPSGVDQDGKPLYDTIWIIKNDILTKADLSDMTKTFTMFIPTDEAILEMFSDMTNYLVAANYPITSADTSLWITWMLRASIQPGAKVYAPGKTLPNGLYDGATYDLKTDYQICYDQTPKQYANGRSYTLNKLRIPRYLYVSSGDANPYTIRVTAPGYPTNKLADNNGLDKFTDHLGLNVSGPQDGNKSVFIQYGRKSNREDETEYAAYTYKTTNTKKSIIDKVDSLYIVNIMPGYYNVRIRLFNYTLDGKGNKTDSVLIKINGEAFTTVKGITKNYYSIDLGGFINNGGVPGATTGIVPVYIPGKYGPAEVAIELYPFKPGPAEDEILKGDPDYYRSFRRIEVGLTKFIAPMDANY